MGMPYYKAIELASSELKNCSNCRHRGAYDNDISDSPFGCSNRALRESARQRGKLPDDSFYLQYASEARPEKPYCVKYKRDMVALKQDAVCEWARLRELEKTENFKRTTTNKKTKD